MYVYPQQMIFTSVSPGEIQPFILSQSPDGLMTNNMSDPAARQIPALPQLSGSIPNTVHLIPHGIRQSQSYQLYKC